MKTPCLTCLILLVAGCAYSREQNDNNGAAQTLTMTRPGGPLAALEPLTVSVRRQEIGTYDCVDSPGGPSFGSLPGSGPSTACTYAGTPAPIEAIVEARCDDGACTTRIIDASRVELTSTVSPASVTLHVSARLTNGLIVSDEWVLHFVPIDGLDVGCTEWAECPGPNALFVGTRLSLSVVPSSGPSPVVTHVRFVVEPLGSVELRVDEELDRAFSATRHFTLRALQPGVATVHFTSGGRETTRSFRIVGTADALRGRVWKIAKDLNLFSTSDNPLGEPVADALEVRKHANSTGEMVELLVGWELNDGTVAVGGAAGVKSSVRNFILASTHSDDDQSPLSRLLVDPFVVPAGQLVTLSAQLDNAMMNQSFRINVVNVP